MLHKSLKDYNLLTPTKLEQMFDDTVRPESSQDAPMIDTTAKCTSRLVSAPYDEHNGYHNTQPTCPSTPTGSSSPSIANSATPSTPVPSLMPALSPVSPCTSVDSNRSGDRSSQRTRYTNIEQKYHIDPRVLGTGHHGSVRQCIDRQTHRRYAVKSVRKTDPSVKPGCLVREIMLLDEMKHGNIIRMVDVFEDAEYVHIVTDLCEGGELFDKIVEKASVSSDESSSGCFSEQESARILHQILQAVSYMHRHNVVHRDIKPENILFQTKDEDSPIQIIDFGLARKHFANRGEPPMKTIVGTPYYISPDVLSKSYGKACDLWSVGVIAYVLLCGYPPFNGGNNKEIYRAIQRGKVYFPSQEWKSISVEARDFVSRLLQKDPRRRMTVEQTLMHPWIVGQLTGRSTGEEMKEGREDMSVEVVFEEESRKDSILCCDVTRQVERMDIAS